MQLPEYADSTSLSYWLNWRVLLCAIWVLTPMIVAAFLIWKYERSSNSESDRRCSSVPCYDDLWKPCIKRIHPICLMCFRIIAFCLLLVALIFDVAIHGFELFFYYTQLTFTLVTVYFGLGSLLSMHGCYQHFKTNSNYKFQLPADAEQGLYVPLAHGVNGNGVISSEGLDYSEKSHVLLTPGFWARLFQILYQMTAGAVTLTDSVYWVFIFPFMNLRDYEMNFLTVVTHSLNAVLLLGDTALNRLPFPWFRMSYFFLWTGFYVIFQWLFHAFVPLWWPYPFLDLSSSYCPLCFLSNVSDSNLVYALFCFEICDLSMPPNPGGISFRPNEAWRCQPGSVVEFLVGMSNQFASSAVTFNPQTEIKYYYIPCSLQPHQEIPCSGARAMWKIDEVLGCCNEQLLKNEDR